MNKRNEHEILVRLVQDFLDRGGSIQVIPDGQRGECKPLSTPPLRPNPIKQSPTGVRCVICDWSPTNPNSISNPEIAEYGGNQLVVDDLTGDMLCRVCLSHSARMNRDFKIEADPGHGQSRYLLNDEAKEVLSSEGHFDEYQGRRQVFDPILNHISDGSKRKGPASLHES